ncbi:MAG: 2-hydroxyacyl-CoA dehydratase [Candidatus Hydrogenedentes bacterium]|nr:2-hydroxyacyl-CoA dehydratase [Candidatus Hydrogenedentota bacterium]
MKHVYYTSPFVPPVWIAAHGLKPCLMNVSARDTGTGTSPGECPYARAVINQASRRDDSLFVLTATCDQMRRAAEWLSLEFEQRRGKDEKAKDPYDLDSPVFLLNVPATWHSAARDRYRAELARLGRFLVRKGGRSPDASDLRESLRSGRLQLHVPHTDPVGVRTTAVPLAVVGGPLMEEHAELYRVIERNGGSVALNGSEGCERSQVTPGDASEFVRDPLGMLTALYFDSIGDAFRRPDSGLARWLVPRIEQRSIRGVVFYAYTWCDLWRAQYVSLAEAVKLPSLLLELGGEERLSAGTITRIQAFMESLR